MASSSSSATVVRDKIPRAAALAVGYSVAANLIARQLLSLVIEFPAGFLPLTPGAIAVFTLIGTALGGVVFWLMARALPNPLRYHRLNPGAQQIQRPFRHIARRWHVAPRNPGARLPLNELQVT
ncbi:MAG: hypothetical protein ACK4SN_06535, partial [Bellilinea sp.]